MAVVVMIFVVIIASIGKRTMEHFIRIKKKLYKTFKLDYMQQT